MKLVEIKCKNCGAKLKIEPDNKNVTCKYCNTDFILDDEVKKVKLTDMEQSGYDFEKGRIRAQKEEKSKVEEESSKDNNKFFKYSKDRPMYVNIIYTLIAFIGMFIIPTVFYLILNKYIKNEVVCNLISDVIFIGILYLMYFKDLNNEFKIYKGNFKENFKISFKYYILGFMGMVFFNLLIAIFLGNISSNESQVRDMLYSSVIPTMISISIIAPIMEELIFRKSLQPVIKNKWIYVVVCGLLFGGAHIMTNILNNAFVLTDLFYILPYASLGGSFALMDHETKTTYSSIVIHAMHNTCTALLLLITYFGGK